MNKPSTKKSITSASTLGGTGWQPRFASLQEEISQGSIWRHCGYQSESSRLTDVVLSWPGKELEFDCQPNEMLMLEQINLATIRRQTRNIAAFYEKQGITVHLLKKQSTPPPNFLFQRDLFWATPAGVILARPAARQRAGEERFAAEALAKIGVPITMHFRGTATFEGADALWLDKKTVLLGTGVRTNAEGARQLAVFLQEIDVKLIETTLPESSQHLLGIVNFVAPNLAVIHGGKITRHLTDILSARGIKTLVIPDGDELNCHLAMNFVTISPGRVVMPKGGATTKSRLAAAGIEIMELDISEYLKAAGGLACLTGILRRE